MVQVPQARTYFSRNRFSGWDYLLVPKTFPSNIQGLPTWYEVRVNDKGYIGRRDGVDLMVAVNAQSLMADIKEIKPGGYLLYDSSKMLYSEYITRRCKLHWCSVNGNAAKIYRPETTVAL